MKYVSAFLAAVLLTGCASGVTNPEPSSPPSAPAPSASPVVSERPRPDCLAVSADEITSFSRIIESPDISITKGAAVKLPAGLRKNGYTKLVGVTLGGPGVDDRGATLAVGDKDRDPLPVDDLARGTFTRGPQVKASSDLGKYRAKLAASESATDALVCAAQ